MKCLPVIVCPAVTRLLPVANGSLVVFGGVKKAGKSTVTANVAEPLVERGSSVMVISTEEPEDHVRLRVASLTAGIPFVRCLPTAKVPLTDVEWERITVTVERQKPHLQVVGLGNGPVGWTTTPKGIAQILDAVACRERKLDLIMLDYTKIEPSRSGQDKRGAILEVMHRLDSFKNECGIPVIVFSQVWSANSKDDEPFSARTKECRSICDLATHTVEIRKDREHQMTLWTRHDWRWDDGREDKAITKWEEGRFRDPSPEELHAYLEAMKARKGKRKSIDDDLAGALQQEAEGVDGEST